MVTNDLPLTNGSRHSDIPATLARHWQWRSCQGCFSPAALPSAGWTIPLQWRYVYREQHRHKVEHSLKKGEWPYQKKGLHIDVYEAYIQVYWDLYTEYWEDAVLTCTYWYCCSVRVAFKWSTIYLFYPQLVLIQDTLHFWQADLVSVCEMDIVFKDCLLLPSG